MGLRIKGGMIVLIGIFLFSCQTNVYERDYVINFLEEMNFSSDNSTDFVVIENKTEYVFYSSSNSFHDSFKIEKIGEKTKDDKRLESYKKGDLVFEIEYDSNISQGVNVFYKNDIFYYEGFGFGLVGFKISNSTFTIKKCVNFDFDNFICRDWVDADVPYFIDNNMVNFFVDNFSAYSISYDSLICAVPYVDEDCLKGNLDLKGMSPRIACTFFKLDDCGDVDILTWGDLEFNSGDDGFSVHYGGVQEGEILIKSSVDDKDFFVSDYVDRTFVRNGWRSFKYDFSFRVNSFMRNYFVGKNIKLWYSLENFDTGYWNGNSFIVPYDNIEAVDHLGNPVIYQHYRMYDFSDLIAKGGYISGNNVYCFDGDFVEEEIDCDPSILEYLSTHFVGSFINTSVSGNTVILKNDLLLFYPFETNISGDSIEDMGGNDWGTASGGVNYSATGGKFGGSYNFDGLNDLITVSEQTALDLVVNFSYGAWFKLDNISANNSIISNLEYNNDNRDGYSLKADSTKDISCLGANNNNYINSQWNKGNPVVGRWYFAVCVMNDTNMSLYVDGVLEAVNATSIRHQSTQRPVIGRATVDLNNNYFNGTIDNVFVINRTLNCDEIVAMNNSLTTPIMKYPETGQYISPARNGTENAVLYTNFSWNGTIGYSYQTNSSDYFYSNLVGHWRFDDVNCLYEEKYNLSGSVIVGEEYYTNIGRINGACGLKNASHYFNASFMGPLVGFSNNTGTNSFNDIFITLDSNVFYVYKGDTDTYSTVSLTSPQNKMPQYTWNHIIVTWDINANMVVYINGELIGSDADDEVCGAGKEIKIGNSDSILPGQYTNFTIDNLMIWNKTLTSYEINELYKQQLGVDIDLSVRFSDDNISWSRWYNLFDSNQSLFVYAAQYVQYSANFITGAFNNIRSLFSSILGAVSINYDSVMTCDSCHECNTSAANLSVFYLVLNSSVGSNNTWDNCISVVGRNDLLIDCSNNSIFGAGSTNTDIGIYVYKSRNITVKNCVFTNFSSSGTTSGGIKVEDSWNVTAVYNDFTKSGSLIFYYPIYLDDNVSFSNFSFNNFTNTYDGIKVTGGTGLDNFSNSFFEHNLIKATNAGYNLVSGNNQEYVTIRYNFFNGTGMGIGLYGGGKNSSITENNFTIPSTASALTIITSSALQNSIWKNIFESGAITEGTASANSFCEIVGNWYGGLETDERIATDCGPNPNVHFINVDFGPFYGVIFGANVSSQINFTSINLAAGNAAHHSLINITPNASAYTELVNVYNLENLTFDGNSRAELNDSGQSGTSYGFYLSTVKNVTIGNFSIRNHKYGIYVGSGSRYVTILNNNISASSTLQSAAIYLDSNVTDVLIQTNNLESAAYGHDYGVRLYGAAGINRIANVSILNNNITVSGYSGIDLVFYNEYTQIKWNNISVDGDGIAIGSDVNNTNITMNNITAIGNFVNNVGVDINTGAYTNNTIARNIFYNGGIRNTKPVDMDFCEGFGNWYFGGAGYYREKNDCGPWPLLSGLINIKLDAIRGSIEWNATADNQLNFSSIGDALNNIPASVYFINISSHNYSEAVYVTHRNNITFECNYAVFNDSSIGNSDQTTGSEGDPFFLVQSSQNITFQDCNFSYGKSGTIGIMFRGSTYFDNNNTVKDSFFTSTFIGVIMDDNSSYINVTNNTFWGYKWIRAAIYLDGTNSFTSTQYNFISKNKFTNFSTNSETYGYKGSSIVFGDFAHNNTLGYNNFTGDVGVDYAVYCNGNSDDNLIIANNFSSFKTNSLYLNSNCDRYVIYNNTFMSNETNGPPKDLSGDGANQWNSSTGNRWLDYDTAIEGCVDVDNNGFCDYQVNVQDLAAPSGIWDYWPLTNNLPSVSNIFINSSYGMNLTYENLSAFVTSEDVNANSISLVYDWRENNASLFVLNYGLECNSNVSLVKDYSSWGNNGTASGVLCNSSGGYDFLNSSYGKSNSSGWVFYGLNDKVTIIENINLDFTRNFSYGGWIRMNTQPINSNFGVISNVDVAGDGYNLEVSSAVNAGITCDLYNTNTLYRVDMNAQASAGKWYFAVCVMNDTSISLYIDGIFKETLTASIRHDSTSKPLLGHYYVDGGTNLYFNGTMDGIFIINKTLTLSEITAMNDSGVSLYALHSYRTFKNNNYSVAVTPNDGSDDGLSVFSNNILINTSLSIVIQNITDSFVNNITLVRSALVGQNLTFMVNVSNFFNESLGNVWIVIWQTIRSVGTKIFEGLLGMINGIWQIGVVVNETFPRIVNYTIYANDSSNILVNLSDGSFLLNQIGTVTFFINSSYATIFSKFWNGV